MHRLAAILLLLVSGPVSAQTYPSVTFQNLTVLGTATIPGTGGGLTPDATGGVPLLAADGSAYAYLHYVPKLISPNDLVSLQPGISNIGAAVHCTSLNGIDANVNCTIAMDGTGNLYVGNASGMLFSYVDPGAAVQAYPQTTTATQASLTITTTPVATPGQNAASVGFNFNGFAFAAGVGGRARGNGCIAVGYGAQCDGFASTALGSSPYDQGDQAVLVHSSGGQNTSGDRQWEWQELHLNTSNAAGSTPLTYDGTGTLTSRESIPLHPKEAARVHIIVLAKNLISFDECSWDVKAGAHQTAAGASGTVLDWQSGAASSENACPSDLTGVAIALSADTTFGLLKIIPTGLAATNIAWQAHAEWIAEIN